MVVTCPPLVIHVGVRKILQDSSVYYVNSLVLVVQFFNLLLRINQASVCETFSIRVYLVNESSMVLCFQTSTVLSLLQVENWTMNHGILSTFFF